MSNFHYTQEHEWIQLVDDNEALVGISDYAQEQLGEIVFVEMPEVGSTVAAGDDVSVIESVKAAGDLKAPVGGEIIAVNEKLNDQPELLNSDPLQEGWIYRVRVDDLTELDLLMDEAAYTEFTESLE